jgi:predicted acylesterase/phospholipase RssA
MRWFARSEETLATNYFAHCWGVFEGGGVRAAAHAGAFAAAKSAGVTFGRVAGTSGGSIVAALVAAGATPQFLTEELGQLDFASLLSSPSEARTVFTKLPIKWRWARRISSGAPRKILDLATYSGLHDSERLEAWVEDRLQKLVQSRRTPGTVGPVTFSELSIPLHVVATDLSTRRPRVWSCEETPHESVAHAVRCSCSIPFFFQPISHGSSLLVDGGVLSNLPAFAFSSLGGSSGSRSVLSRVLAFRLVEDANSVRPPKDLAEFGAALAGAAIDGATHIQSQLQPHVHTIRIPTGTVRSTDFSGVDTAVRTKLYEAGRQAVRQFIDEERLTARSNPSAVAYRGFDEKMLLLVQELLACGQSFFAVGRSTYWLDFIFPSLLAAARRGIQISVITSRYSDLNEQRRQWLLGELGAEVVVLEGPLPFDGFAFDIDEARSSAILTASDRSQQGPSDFEHERVRLYTRNSDPVLLDLLTEKLKPHWRKRAVEVRALPYSQCADIKLFGLLRKLRMYSDAKLRMTDVDVCDDVLVLQQAVKEFKVLQIRTHMRDLEKHGVDYFSLTEIDLPGGHGSIVTPPVLERVGDRLILIDGNTRFFHCLASGIAKVRAVVVEGVEEKLPASDPRPLSTLKLVSATTTFRNMYSEADKSLVRRIDEAAHPFPH